MTAVATEEEVLSASKKLTRLRDTLGETLFGQQTLIEQVVIGVLSRGHLLLEGLPGLGKTLLVKALARATGLQAGRIQFTPDLLPGDITGNPVLQEDQGRRRFVFQPGPVFAHLVLADEINRASPKTQSALLEAMQEGRVTVTGEAHPLPQPFFVMATQNPIEMEGTYPLPEAQLDRFLFKLEVPGSPVEVLERIVLEREIGVEPEVQPQLDGPGLIALLDLVRRIYMPPVVANYIARLVDATHPGRSAAAAGVRYGASPRAALALGAGVRARALLGGRQNASFEDVQALALPALQHRLVLDYQARLDGATPARVISRLLQEVSTQKRDLPAPLAPTSPSSGPA